MLIFWWVGRGYWTLLLLFLVGMVVAIVQELLGGVGSEGPWFAVAVFGIGAVVNWILGCRFNRRSTSWPGFSSLRRRLIYPARDRFMGLPMESWSVAMAAIALLLALRGTFGTG